ncbi:cell division protein FtsQ/DivIB [Parasediminibacterium sp. JCM 36343]|uniref:cell division protein FtsQ/DivIB n=1 Tax=Parasediminibacterium sp. JCM 36343 TaxID=3374279 RepID=UPI00397C3F57
MVTKKKITQIGWLLFAAGTIVLFAFAMEKKNNKACTDVKVEITGADEHLFIDEKDVLQLISGHAYIDNRTVSSIDLRNIETELEKTPWVKNAELFFDNKQILQVRIEERQPVARVFTVQGNSFYVDSGGMKLPLSEKLSARVPMFTNFPSDKNIMAASDSDLLKGVVDIGKYITADSFWRAQVEQVNITPQATFEIVPTIGNQIVVFGTATDVESKFNKLYTFYKKAWVQNGINTYEKLDIQYKDQVVAVRAGTAITQSDSAKAKAAMNALMKGNVVFQIDSLSPIAGKRSDTVAVKKLLQKLPVKPNNKKKLANINVQNNKSTKKTLTIKGKYKLPVNKAKPPLKNRSVVGFSSGFF